MQGRVLQEVEGYTVAQWEIEYERLRKVLPKFREEIQSIPEKEQQVLAIAKIDGFISLPVVISILTEIREITEKEISETFTKLTGKDIKKAIIDKPMRDIFTRLCGKDIRSIIEKLSADTRTADLTAEKVHAAITAYATTFLNRIKKDYKRDTNEKDADAQLLPLICNQLYLLCAADLYAEADARQTAGWLKIKTLMGPYLLRECPNEALQNPFIAVRECAKLLQVNIATGQLWKEAALWLKGLYMRCFLNIPEKFRKDGGVILDERKKMPLAIITEKGSEKINEKDKSLQDNFGLTLYEIGRFHFETAENIEARFAPLPKASISASPKSDALSLSSPQNSPPMEQELHAASAPQQSLPMMAHNAVVSTVRSPYTTGATFFNSSKELIPVVPATLVHFHALETIHEEKDDELKFTMFSNFLDEYGLTERQVRLLREFPDTIIAKLDIYIGAYFTTSWVPTIFVARRYRQLAIDTKSYIESESNIAEQIKTLCTMWRTLKYGESKDLIEKIDSSIKFAIGILYQDMRSFKNAKESNEIQMSRANN